MKRLAQCFTLFIVVVVAVLVLAAGKPNPAETQLTRAFTEFKTAVLNGDFQKAEQYLLSPAKERWWLDDLGKALERRATLPENRRRLIDEMFAAYCEMLKSATPLAFDFTGDTARVMIRMETIIGAYRAPIMFPTTWRRGGGKWRLVDADWNSERLRKEHGKLVQERSIPQSDPGYPPFHIADQNEVRTGAMLGLLSDDDQPPTCPADMALIVGWHFLRRFSGQRYIFSGEADHDMDMPLFCIDRYEASRPNATATSPGSGYAHPAQSRSGVMPWILVSWTDADAACKKAGKRLCTTAEWQAATGGYADWLYLKSDVFDDDLCNTYDRDNGPRQLAPAGAYPECKNEHGAYDLLGNVSEWTADAWQPGMPDRVICGGSFEVNDHNDQGLYPFFGWQFIGYGESSASIHHHPPDVVYHDDGFRCCREPEPPAK